MKVEKVIFPFVQLLNSVDLQSLHVTESTLDVRRNFTGERPLIGHMLYVGKDDIQRIHMSGDRVEFMGHTLTCSAWEKLDPSELESCCFYLLTHLEETSIPNIGMFSRHIIISQCFEITRRAIFHNFQKKTEYEREEGTSSWYTRAFGPGYFGMPMEDGRELYEILEGEKLGVKYRNGMLEPLKSCMGVFFSFRGKDKIDFNPCEYCKASKEQCEFCGGF